MRLKSLNVHGFKSFADKTNFDFHPGVTAIVGPNGCGKSNVVDAIRWVLGETSAKALRGGEMADVIFNGTDKRQPLGFADVTMTLADCEGILGVDFNEISLCRRVFRDGRSEYRLNNQVCRRKDVSELLMDTGMGQMAYSIMEQGKIDMLLSSKPEDRRAVFEEAAGITKFKAQKREALRKLDYTEANLVRIADITAEVVRQKGSLQRQAAKARRYQVLLEDVRTLDTHFSHKKFIEFNAERSELENSVVQLRRQQVELQEKIGGSEQHISEARSRFQDLESRITEKRSEASEHENTSRAARSRIEFNTERAREFDSHISRNSEDIDTTQLQLAEQESEIATADEALDRVSAGIARQQTQHDEQAALANQAREEREQLSAAIGQLRHLASDAESTIVSVKAQLASNQSQIDGDSQRRELLAGELAKLESEKSGKLHERAGLAELATTTRTELEKQIELEREVTRACEASQSTLAERERQLADIHRQLAEKSSRLEVLRQLIASGEGFEKGPQAVLGGLGSPDRFGAGIHGTLTGFLEVDPAFIPPIESALGNHLQTVLVEDTGLAEAVIAELANGKLGEASLLAIDLAPSPPPSQMLTLPEGAVAWALDKVSVKSSFKPLIDSVLGKTLIVESLADALRLKRLYGDLTFATLGGELVTPEGVIRGGAIPGGASSPLLRQNEVRELEKLTESLTEERARAANEVESTREQVGKLRQDLEAARAKLQELRVEDSSLTGQVGLADREIQQMSAKLEGVTWEQGELFKRVEQVELQIGELRDRQMAAQADLEKRHTEIREKETLLAETSRRESELSEMVQDLRTALAVERRAEESLRQQKTPMARRLEELRLLSERREAEIAHYREKISAAEVESNALAESATLAEEAGAAVREALRELGEERKRQDEALSATEGSLLGMRRTLATTTEQRGNEEVKVTQIDLRIENLCTAIRERYSVELESFEIDTHALLAAIEEQKKARIRNDRRKATLARSSEGQEGADDDSDGDAEADAAALAEDAPADADGGDEARAVDDLLEPDGPDWEFVESVVGELKRRLDSMGPVNLDAIEEFEELEERHRFLQEQHDDLVRSKDELHQVITKINKTTREMFSDTFAKVRANFKETFRELFGQGARADLLLADEDDPLESGIDIIARPPGKKPTSISLLSGGERSMTAVALLFSIYMVKPSPFCVLDELDAPLDDSNIGRFLKMLDRFIDQSQFVIVTHNKRTMGRADIMYGVTQQEFGVSKLVGMKLTQPGERPGAAKVTS